jgi:hypothetical protein
MAALVTAAFVQLMLLPAHAAAACCCSCCCQCIAVTERTSQQHIPLLLLRGKCLHLLLQLLQLQLRRRLMNHASTRAHAASSSTTRPTHLLLLQLL